MRWQTRTNVHKLANTLDSSRLVEISRANRFSEGWLNKSRTQNNNNNVPYDIKVGSRGNDLHFLKFHDVFELHSHFACLAEQFWV